MLFQLQLFLRIVQLHYSYSVEEIKSQLFLIRQWLKWRSKSYSTLSLWFYIQQKWI